MLGGFGLRYVDEDQALMWVTAQDLLHGRVFTPHFYGQAYGGWLEALVSVPLLAAGAPLRTALPAVATVMGVLPCLLFAAAAWWRRAPLLAAAILTGTLLLTTEAVVVTSFPWGLMPAALLASGGIALVLRRGPRVGTLIVFAVLAALAMSINLMSLLISAPALIFFAARYRLRWWVSLPLLIGLQTGIALHVLTGVFYADHPSYRFHNQWELRLSGGVLVGNLSHLDRLLGPFGLVVASPAVPLALLAAGAVVLAVRQRLPGLLAGLAAVGLVVATLAAPKSTDGTNSVFFPYFRLYLVLPAAIAGLFVLAVRDERLRPGLTRATAVALLVVATAGFMFQQARLNAETAGLVASELRWRNRPARTVAEVRAQCRRADALARENDAGLIVYTDDRLASYLCGAELYERAATIYPPYERRTWRLVEESTKPRTVMLLTGAGGGICDRAAPWVSSCSVVDEELGVVVLRFPPQPVLDLVRRLDIAVRPFRVPQEPRA